MTALACNAVLAACAGRWLNFYSQYTELHREGSQFVGACPLHGGDGPNFKVSAETGEWYCHTGCKEGGDALRFLERKDGLTFPEALQALAQWAGVAATGTNPARTPKPPVKPSFPKSPRGPVVATYDYTDAAGTLLYQVLRYEPGADGRSKDFSQRRPDGGGGWIAKLDGVTRVPYNLPAVLAQVQAGKPVYIVEGEKDVCALRALGLTATCNSGGAGKGNWTDNLSAYLKDARAILLPDNDQVGRAHMESVAQSLHNVTNLVRVVTLPGLPEKGDVSDWITAGGTVDELAKLAKATPNWELLPTPPAIKPTSSKSPKPTQATRPALSDVGNGERLAAKFGHKLRHSGKFGWLVYDGKRWKADDSREVERCAKATVLSILEEALTEPNDSMRGAIAKHAAASQSNSRFKAMIERGGAEAALQVRADQLDADLYLLNVENGTLNLRDGAFRAHDAADYCTHLAPVSYDADAACPKWVAFLERVIPNAETRAFLQRAVGYTLTGDTGAECLFLLWGNGANGKSSFTEVLHALLGDYWCKTRADALMHRDGPQTGASSDIADLLGKRMVAVSEISQESRLNESLIKDLTSRDTLKARHLYKDLFEFTPQHKLWLCGNHKPNIRGTDNGMWRRLRLIPFTVQIPVTERNPNLLLELRQELPGILRWAVAGCLQWQRDGLGTCPEVTAATSGYQSEMDTMGAFLADDCTLGAGFVASAAELYGAYVKWSQENGERPTVQRRFGMALTERGCERYRVGTGYRWRGVGLLANTEGENEDLFSGSIGT